MTAKLRTGLNIPNATGADDDATHATLMNQHRQGGRAEGKPFHKPVAEPPQEQPEGHDPEPTNDDVDTDEDIGDPT